LKSDHQKVKQILINLLSNAAKFSKNSPIEIHVDINIEKEVLFFKVIDQGIGISKDDLETLFHPFMQADNSSTRNFGGTGLGLYLSKEFANILGGNLTAASLLGKGSAFTVSLPIK
jgi:signal transduction histidine kinase